MKARSFIESCTLLVVFQRLAHELSARDHEQRLPDTQTQTRNDTLEETARALLLDDRAEDLNHVLLGLAAISRRLHLDTCDFERVVPARECTTNDTGTGLLCHRELGVRVVVEQDLEAATHDLRKALAGSPVRGLTKGNSSTTRIEALLVDTSIAVLVSSMWTSRLQRTLP